MKPNSGSTRCITFLLFLVFFPVLSGSFPAYADTLRVGIYQNRPKVFIDDNGMPRGIFVDILDEIARQENLTIDYMPGTWTENIRRLENRQIDLLVDVSWSAERAERFQFSSTFVLESWLDLYSRRDARIGSIRDLNAKRIAVLEGSIQEKYLRDEIPKYFNIAFAVLPHSNYADCVRALLSGETDVMIADRFFSFSPLRADGIEPANLIFRPEGLYFAYPKGSDPVRIEAIDRRLASMKNSPDSAYYRSLKHWLNIQRDIVPAWIALALSVISGLLVAFSLFAYLLKRQVAEKTLKLKLNNEQLRHIHEALREANRLLEETQAITGLGGWEYDVTTRRITWTDEVYRIYGVDKDYDPGDVDSDIAFYAPQHALVIRQALRKALEAGEPYDLELELIRRNGERIWVRTMSRPVTENGNVVRVTGNIIDITGSKRAESEKRKLEDQLVMAQKMESVGRLAGGVAHDFNNMLGVILGHAELALGRLDPAQALHADLKEIQKAAMRSTDLTRQLLAFARKQTIAPKVLVLNEIIAGMLKMLRRLIGENIDLVWLPVTDLWLVKMDPAQIDQILANLCINARDAITDVGRIIIETSNTAFDDSYCTDHVGYIPGEYVLISIRDDGCGMNKETLGNIFEPFFTTKESGKGTGLGLATVYGIVKQNNGFIYVDSEPGKGTTFRIFVPRHAGKIEKIAVESAAEVPRSSGETLLLVEDEPALLFLTWRLLEDLGYAVLTAGSPGEALRVAEEHPGEIHLLMTDVVMPEMNGRELAQRIKELRPALKCLFMSGYTSDVIAPRGVLDEGIQFIQKPFTQKDLAVKVEAVLGEKRKNP